MSKLLAELCADVIASVSDEVKDWYEALRPSERKAVRRDIIRYVRSQIEYRHSTAARKREGRK